MESWIASIVPQTGGTFGNDTNSVSQIRVEENKGRVGRSTSIRVKSTKASNTSMGVVEGISTEVTLSQNGLGLYFKLDLEGSSQKASNNGGISLISFSTNAKGLSFIAGGIPFTGDINNYLELYINSTKVEGWNNSTTYIPNDPGAKGIYNGYFKFNIPENPDKTKQRTITVSVTAIGDTESDTITKNTTILQGENYYLNVSPRTLNYTSDGGVNSINIDSNVEWEIS